MLRLFLCFVYFLFVVVWLWVPVQLITWGKLMVYKDTMPDKLVPSFNRINKIVINLNIYVLHCTNSWTHAAGMCSSEGRQLGPPKSGTLHYRHSRMGRATKTTVSTVEPRKNWIDLVWWSCKVGESTGDGHHSSSRASGHWACRLCPWPWRLTGQLIEHASAHCQSHQPVSFISGGSASLATYSTWKPGSDLSALWY